MEELKPCPFCGEQPEAEWVTHNSVKPDSVMIYCCYVSMDKPNEEAAAKAWNTRANEQI